MDQVLALQTGGRIKPGDMLPSVRDLGAFLGVNIMTISKAYARLEAEGVIERVRGKGMILREPKPSGSLSQRAEELKPFLEQSVVRGRQLGLSDEQIMRLLEKILKERPPTP
jgi:GntR family transcriptional regulator